MQLIKKLATLVSASLLFAMPLVAEAGPGAPPAAVPSAAPNAGAPAAPAKKGAAAPAAAPSASPAAGPAAGAPAVPPGPGGPQPTGAAVPNTGGKPVAPGGPAAVATSAPAAAAGPAMDGPTYAVRLRDLEQRIDELKEQIRRSHTRLSLLSDTILSGGGAGSRANIRFQNELSSAFKVVRVLVVLDGAVQYNKTDQSGALSEQSEIPIFINGSIPPGDHTLQVLVGLQGNGFGVFSYLRAYKWELRSSHSFTAVEGKTINLQAIAYEKGGVTTPLGDRPAIRYVEKVVSGLSDAGSTPAPAAAPATPTPAVAK